nr:MAG TPA: hypothetical protein [Caudoviricetes sp.]
MQCFFYLVTYLNVYIMAKSNTGFRRGNIVGRANASSAIKAENKAIANRPSGWTAKEAQRAHRKSNAKSLGRSGRSKV